MKTSALPPTQCPWCLERMEPGRRPGYAKCRTPGCKLRNKALTQDDVTRIELWIIDNDTE